ncbi:MAG TPA: ABC transporter permease [Solirubrobacteraceae bacterium]|jgi:ABC-2 type transport system permease protein|nr:ABC transporter permease [Solirubrobacteraceae bacterium]
MTVLEETLPTKAAARRSPRATTFLAFRAFIARDLTVLDSNLQRFVPSAVMQPLLLVFVFTYLFPAIGMTVGGSAGGQRFSTTLLPGVLAQSILFVGIFSVGMNLILELDADELEDRVLAPVPIATVAVAKIFSGACQAFVAALIVFPVAAFLPSTGIYLFADWPVLVTVLPLACITAASLGLALGVVFDPRSGPWLFSVVALPLAFFGAVFYTWDSLVPVPVIHYGVLANPLVYMSEGLRAATVAGIPHMSLTAVYGALAGFTTLFTVVGVRGFRRRVVN